LEFHNIAIIKLSSLGDIIHTLPAVNRLRSQYTQAKISWIVAPAGAHLLKNFSGLDEIIVIDLKVPGLKSKYREIRRVISQYKKSFDLVLDFQGLLKSAILGFLLGGHFVGFHKKNLREPLSRLFYKEYGEFFDESKHVIFKNLNLVEKITGSPSPAITTSPQPFLPLEDLKESPELKQFLVENHLKNNDFIILNVGGGWETKVLDIQQNINIIENLGTISPQKIIVLWGNDNEKVKAREICSKTGSLMAPFLVFSDLIRLIRMARLIVTGDTLALHLSDLVKTPSVGFFGPTTPGRNGSLLMESRAIYERNKCGFCYKKKCDTITCIKKINLKKIIKTIEKMYEKHR